MTQTLTVTATEANRTFAKIMRKVREGASIDITSHGETIAEIRPKRKSESSERKRRLALWEEHRAILEAREFKIIEPWTRAQLYERD